MPDIHINEDERRFELPLEDGIALLEYRYRGRDLALVHTEVPPKWQGRGFAAQLVKFALEYARERNLMVIPVCPYVRLYIRRHPEYHGLLKQPGAFQAGDERSA
jgi:predicted GNAT family acetyltransferase